MKFVVGNISPSHYQPSLTEYTYAFLRITNAERNKDFMVSHITPESFCLVYTPDPHITSKLTELDRPLIRIQAHHSLGLSPRQMTQAGFDYLASTIMRETATEVASRAPKREFCYCRTAWNLKKEAMNLLKCRGEEFIVDGVFD